MIRLGVLRASAPDALPFAREKLRRSLLAAGLRPVLAGQVTAFVSQQLRGSLPSEINILLDDDRRHIVLDPPAVAGRYNRLALPQIVDDKAIDAIQVILARLTREELLHDLERQVQERTAELAHEKERSERLLKNMLPDAIAERMKAGETIADTHEASVLFADICGFTAMAKDQRAQDVVQFLDRIFRRFDEIAHHHELEKIKTIGDCYMAAAGIPLPQADHLDRAVLMGLDIIDTVKDISANLALPLDVRVGVHAGPLVAGVIGAKKYSYDVWGDTVNVASRMESQGIVGHLQISDDAKKMLGKRFDVEDRGIVEIKNRGQMRVWLVSGLAPLST